METAAHNQTAETFDDTSVDTEQVLIEEARTEQYAEFDAAYDAFLTHAATTMDAFICSKGDVSLLAGMHPEWIAALSARLATRLGEYDDDPSQIPRSEIDGMTSVAAIGYVAAKFGPDFGTNDENS